MISRSILFLWLVGLGFFPFCLLGAKEIPAAEVKILEEALSSARNEDGSAARKRLAVKRVVRDAGKLLESHGDAKTVMRFWQFCSKSKQLLFGMDNSTRNRTAVLETASELLKAPDAYAASSPEADLLMTQTSIGSQGSESS